jgi:hypothetical protein
LSCSPPLAHQRRDRVLHRFHLLRGQGRNPDLLDVVVAGHAPLHGQDRHQDRIVLVLPERRLPFHAQNADDLAGRCAEPDLGADRVLMPEQLLARRLAQYAHRPAAALFAVGEHAPMLHRPLAHGEVRVRRALDADLPVLRTVHGLCLLDGGRCDGGDALDLALDRVRIVHLERRLRGRWSGPLRRERQHEEQVAPHRGDVGGDLDREPLAQRHDGHDGGHAHDDAERREQRAKQVRPQFPPSQLQRRPYHEVTPRLSV